MKPSLDFAGLKKCKPWEYGVRFLFGGLVTVAAGLAAHHWGPVIGGLFLAFPAILPASLTLVKEHDGRSKAADDARGGRVGSVGLLVFALAVWAVAGHASPAVVLAGATCGWLFVSMAIWALERRRDG